MIRCSPTQRTFQGNPGVFSFPVHEAECGPCEDPGVFICRSVIRAAAGLLLTKPHHMPVYLHKKHLFKCFPERAPELTLLPRSMHFYTELPISIWPSCLNWLMCTDVYRYKTFKLKTCTHLVYWQNLYSFPGRPDLAPCLLRDRWGFQPDIHLNKTTVIKRIWLKKLHKLEQTAVIWKEQTVLFFFK